VAARTPLVTLESLPVRVLTPSRAVNAGRALRIVPAVSRDPVPGPGRPHGR